MLLESERSSQQFLHQLGKPYYKPGIRCSNLPIYLELVDLGYGNVQPVEPHILVQGIDQ
jgi:hypothetical protein